MSIPQDKQGDRCFQGFLNSVALPPPLKRTSESYSLLDAPVYTSAGRCLWGKENSTTANLTSSANTEGFGRLEENSFTPTQVSSSHYMEVFEKSKEITKVQTDLSCSTSKDILDKSKEKIKVETDPSSLVNREVVQKSPVESGSERTQRRKPLHPKKSPALADPDFRGVTLCFHTVLHGSSSELIITPIFSKNLSRLSRRHRHRHRSLNSESEHDGGHSTPEEHSHSSDEQRVRTSALQLGVKSCASCATRRTPLWRDAEDGTPLCNACGIRYRKYRLRCSACWHIPRKDNKVFPACSQCGGVLRFSQTRKC